MNWSLPDQKKLALSGAHRNLRIALGGVPHLVVIEQQCFERVWNAVALASNDFLKCAPYESERIARTRV